MAPYRHFYNKNDLLAAVAAEGFKKLWELMEREAKGKSPLDKLKEFGRVYIGFPETSDWGMPSGR